MVTSNPSLQSFDSPLDSIFHSASSSSFGHAPLVAEVKSLKHDVIEMKNTITELKEMIKHMAGHSRVAGQRVEVKPSGLSAKNEIMEASKIYFQSHNNVLEGGPVEMDDCELERRYDLSYTAIKNFVTVSILPQELLALTSDNHMFSYLGADNCLPLFAFTKSWRSKNLLVAAIRNRVESIPQTKIQPEASTTIFNEIEESEDELARDVNTSVSTNEGDNLETLDCDESDETQKTREREFALEQAKLRRSATSSKNNKGPVANKPRKQKKSSASSHPSVVTPTTKKHI
ncbi:hypothetical protein INT47_001393 [Mucor saturninus]|uniref:Uncharacterized protein n=1 Tax=Mucor saturninus TaxID=64648 RepID=A0A8H7URA2_9FUNG|nr:hypothetical protein INT47_001393 [Mucor saturninus]